MRAWLSIAPAVWLCSLTAALLCAQDGSLATFGTTVVIPGGLTGQIYAIPPYSDKLPKFEKLEPIGTIYAKGLYIPPTDFTEGFPGITDRTEWFAIDFTGRFYIRDPGRYQFNLCSDDGSRLYFDGKQAIDNDGVHGTECRDVGVKLSGGVHSIRLSYFQGPRYHLSLMLSVWGPSDKGFHAFNTDHFAAPQNPADWKYGDPNSLATESNSDAGRRNLRDVLRRANPMVSISIAALSNGRAVRGLQAADFVLHDAGERREVTSLAVDEQPLDIILLVDGGPGMDSILERMKREIRKSLASLRVKDRVGIVLFAEKQVLLLGLAANRDMAAAAVQKIHTSAGTKDLNGAVALSAQYLRSQARPESTPVIVILTDNQGGRGVSDRATRDALWQGNIVLGGLLVKGDPRAEADVRQFIDATGGEALFADETAVPLAEIFRRLQTRFRLTYRAPGGKPKTIRTISVELTPEARVRLGDVQVRAPSGYVVADSGDGH